MKRIAVIALTLLMALTGIAYAAAIPLKVLINGQEVKFTGSVRLENGSLYFPVSELMAKVGIQYKLNEASQTMEITDPRGQRISDLETRLAQAEAELKQLKGQSAATPPQITATPTGPSNITTTKTLIDYLNSNMNQVSTPTGTIRLTYSVSENDRNYMPYDLWLKFDWDPFLYFTDLTSKVSISEADRQASVKILREHSKAVYEVAHKAFPSKKIEGGYHRSWWRYPNLQLDLITRDYFSWQNYDWDILGSGNAYENAPLTEFQFTPDRDDAKF